jgi:hypothetical protein
MQHRHQLNEQPPTIWRRYDLNKIVVIGAIVVVVLALALCAWAGESDVKNPISTPPPLETPPQSLIHGLINIELSDHYMTPRGLTIFF